jgi:prepilin-type N-terminal cleavage/methylation domain-containing protein
MGIIARVRSRLACERGWSLTELLVVIALLGVILGATITSITAGRNTAVADQERADTVAQAQTAITRMTTDLRHGYLFHVGADSSCGASTSWTNCIDFDARGRTSVDTSTTPPTVTRAFARIRYDCFTANKCVRSRTTANCVGTSCTSPPTLSAPPATGSTLIANLQNSTVTAPGATPAPVFDYLKAGGISMASAEIPASSFSASPPYSIRVTLAVARKGERRRGLAGNVYFQGGADLKNMNPDVSPCAQTYADC